MTTQESQKKDARMSQTLQTSQTPQMSQTPQPAHPSRPAPLVRFRDVTKTYPMPRRSFFAEKREIKALDQVNFELYPGETLGIVGESGSGKSTLARCLVDLIRPDAGEIFLRERPLRSYSRIERARTMQYIFQDPQASLNPRRSVRWILEEPLRCQTDLSADERARRVAEFFPLAGLPEDILDATPRELSGGQAQRVSILAALINRPPILIADEAVSALDVSVQAQILNFLQELKAEFGLTMIFITHDIHVCYHLSDRIIVMEKGRIVEEGPAEELFHHPRASYTQKLFSSVLSLRPLDEKGHGPF